MFLFRGTERKTGNSEPIADLVNPKRIEIVSQGGAYVIVQLIADGVI